MPVTLEKITQVTPQDNQDLVKIYQKYPHLEIDDYTQWTHNQLANQHQLFAGRFNGRLVASVWATSQPNTPNTQWQLDYLCVRDITQRRGVARQLMTLIVRKADTLNVTLTMLDQPGCEIIHPLLKQLTFQLITIPQGSIWQRNPQL